MSKKLGASLEQAMPEGEMDHETESHIRTLGDAADIMSDPEKLKKVHALAGRKHKAIMGLVEPAMMKKGPKIKTLRDLKDEANKPFKDSDKDKV